MKEKIYSIAKNSLITIMILLLSTILCFFLRNFASTDTHVPLIFVLAVLFVSRFTEGYCYGVIAAMVAVVGVNYIFTYPYFQIDFTITGYPITFLAMLAVAISVSALTTQIKKQEQIRLEVEKEKMRANLLRAVSHDIRTPLTSIAGSAAGILDNQQVLSNEKVIDLVGNIKEEAEWMVRMVENLLSITRMNTENAKIDTREELVEEVVGGSVVKFQKRFPEVQVIANIPDEVLLVPMDVILIEQVIVNLMENSVVHGHATKIKILVERKNTEIVFRIKDNGAGIEEEVLPHIFDGSIGSRSGETGDSKRNMGIGLSVCKSIVKAHKGNMMACNDKEGGASVSFTIPFEEEIC